MIIRCVSVKELLANSYCRDYKSQPAPFPAWAGRKRMFDKFSLSAWVLESWCKPLSIVSDDWVVLPQLLLNYVSETLCYMSLPVSCSVFQRSLGPASFLGLSLWLPINSGNPNIFPINSFSLGYHIDFFLNITMYTDSYSAQFSMLLYLCFCIQTP
jgi:hypothetical protein